MSYYRTRSTYAAKPREEVPDFEKRWSDLRPKEIEGSWGASFLDSIKEEYKKQAGLTFKQLRTFQKLEKAHSAEGKAADSAWSDEYRANYESDAKILVEHFDHPDVALYWANVLDKCRAGAVPPRGPFLKMFGNKFSQAVIAAHKAEPKFSQGSVVQVRSNYSAKPFQNVLCMVIKTDLVPIRVAKTGTKRYTLLPFGSQNPITLDEAYLMKKNKNGKVYDR